MMSSRKQVTFFSLARVSAFPSESRHSSLWIRFSLGFLWPPQHWSLGHDHRLLPQPLQPLANARDSKPPVLLAACCLCYTGCLVISRGSGRTVSIQISACAHCKGCALSYKCTHHLDGPRQPVAFAQFNDLLTAAVKSENAND